MRRCKAAHQSCLFLRQADLLGAIPLVVRTNFLLEFLDGWHALVYFHTSNTFAMTSQQAVSNEIVLGSPLIVWCKKTHLAHTPPPRPPLRGWGAGGRGICVAATAPPENGRGGGSFNAALRKSNARHKKNAKTKKCKKTTHLQKPLLVMLTH